MEDACAGVSPVTVADAHRKFACERVLTVLSTGHEVDALPLRVDSPMAAAVPVAPRAGDSQIHKRIDFLMHHGG